MRKIEDIIQSIGISIDEATVMTYIHLDWVRPTYRDNTYYLEEIDIARIRLIYQFKEDMMIEDNAIDIILSLMDQLNGARDQLQVLCAAIGAQSASIQDSIQAFIETQKGPI